MIKRILFADNDTDFRVTRTEFLEDEEYQVISASSPEEARARLSERHIHLAILDIRLRNDEDEKDVSGLSIAKDPAFGSIPKIILTSFPSHRDVREVMKPTMEGLPSAVDFLSKQDGPEAMIAAVHNAFEEYVRMNWQLAIHWNEKHPLSFPHLTNLLKPQLIGQQLSDLAEEFEDLFRKIFYDSDQITIDRAFWHKRGRMALNVFAYSQDSRSRQYVVVSGLRELVRRDTTVLSMGGSDAAVSSNLAAETLHFSANCHELIGADLGTVRTFTEFYQQATSRDVTSVLDNLIQTNLVSWHRQPRFVEITQCLATMYRNCLGFDSIDNIAITVSERINTIGYEAAAISLVGVDLSPSSLIIQFPKGLRHTYPNPVAWLIDTGPEQSRLRLHYGVTLGELDSDTIVLNREGQTWLTDFGAVAEGPLLGDYVALETTLKFDLQDDTSTVEDLHELESQLLAANRLNVRLDPGAQRFNKVVSAVQRVRQKASSACGSDIRPYYWGLLFYSAKRILAYEPGIRRTRRELLPLVHACMSMGMICAKLSEGNQATSASATPGGGIEINEANQQVRVDGRLVSMTPTEFAVMLFLWKHPGQLCTREAIVLSAYGHEYTPGKLATDDAKLGVMIDRIREKIEVDPSAPKYLVTKRGAGYILYPSGLPA